MMKDEGPFLIEWVAHHLVLGFTDLVVYTNDCSDGTDDMLIRLEELGLCHHRRNVIPEGLRPQPSALNHAQEEPVVCQSDWVMVFDADEFLSIPYGDGTLDGLIGAAKDLGANGIVVTWRIFGSGGVVDWSRAPVTEQYLLAAPQTWNKGWGVKTLFRFDPDHWKLGIHRPKMKTRWIKTDYPDQVKWLNGSGREMEDYFKFRGWRSITRTVGYDWVQLNHYAVKSVDSYAIRKMRGNVNNKKDKYNNDYWSLQDRNEVRDETMLRYKPQRDALIAQLLQDPVLNRLHFAAVDRAEARLAELRGTEAYHQLVTDLAQASQVPLSQIVAKPPVARDKEKIAALMSDVEKQRGLKARSERKEKLAEPKEPQPEGLYLPGPLDTDADLPMEYVANHQVQVPLDMRLFSPVAMPLIRKGKFQRILARKLPQIVPKGGKALFVGAAEGFLAVNLANTRGDATVVAQESEHSFRNVMLRLCSQSAREIGPRFQVLDAPVTQEAVVEWLRLHRPATLILSDPQLSPELLMSLLPALPLPGPAQILLTGRLVERWNGQLGPVAEMLVALGYRPDFDLPPTVALGFSAVPEPEPDDAPDA
ncbi:glycosyltransferase family 2 protein [Tabrizicola sp. KVB23]|uniref:Glycosyltransferase family 2 protein n=2 Tax=Fuscibacter oryzae TaxID=2803939 RepID=A0A8J7MRG6_9RHOB|nr:glycosyltransferase family 2 protein [Fuscibacter oryzae]